MKTTTKILILIIAVLAVFTVLFRYQYTITSKNYKDLQDSVLFYQNLPPVIEYKTVRITDTVFQKQKPEQIVINDTIYQRYDSIIEKNDVKIKYKIVSLSPLKEFDMKIDYPEITKTQPVFVKMPSREGFLTLNLAVNEYDLLYQFKNDKFVYGAGLRVIKNNKYEFVPVITASLKLH